MLFSHGVDITRLQCAFVNTSEVEKISKFIGAQQGYPSAFELPEYTKEEDESKPGAVDLNRLDPMFEDAARLIIAKQQASTSLLQRKLNIGFARAGRLLDQLEAAGIIGPPKISISRQVLVQEKCCLGQILDSLKRKFCRKIKQERNEESSR